jgi:hypothetical protein
MQVNERYDVIPPTPGLMADLARRMARELGLPASAFAPRKALPPPPAQPSKTIEAVVAQIPEHRSYPPLEAILRAVSIATGVPLMEMKSERRFVPATRARAIFYVAARELTPKSLPAIGKFCGGRDPSTILHGISKVQANRQAFEPELSKVLDAMRGQG